MPAVHRRIPLIVNLRPRKGGGDAIDGIIDEGKDVPWQKVNARDDSHRPINELTKVISLNVFLNRPMKPRKITNEARQALMPDDVLIPLVEVS